MFLRNLNDLSARLAVQLINSSATAASRLSRGVPDIVGTYTQATGGTLEIEIVDLNQGSEYDLLTVAVAASLAGNLEVTLPGDGFAPAPGDSFQILTAGSVERESRRDSFYRSHRSP